MTPEDFCDERALRLGVGLTVVGELACQAPLEGGVAFPCLRVGPQGISETEALLIVRAKQSFGLLGLGSRFDDRKALQARVLERIAEIGTEESAFRQMGHRLALSCTYPLHETIESLPKIYSRFPSGVDLHVLSIIEGLHDSRSVSL